MTDFCAMTSDQLDGWLAVRVMGGNEFFSTTYALHNGRCWQPTCDLNQAVKCAEKWVNISPKNRRLLLTLNDKNYYVQLFEYQEPHEKSVGIGQGNNPARALCEAVAMAMEGEK